MLDTSSAPGGVEDPIFFRSADEFRARPGYHPALVVAEGELARIVGKYAFAKSAMLKCGLNGCAQLHGRGFVVRTKDGRETHCGKDCGRREFGQAFEEFEATFAASIDALGRRAQVTKLVEQSAPLLAQAVELLGSVSELAAGIRRCVDRLEKDPPLAKAFAEAVRLRGQIRREQIVDADLKIAMAAGAQRNFETIDTFEGSDAVDTFRLAASTLQHRVVEPLRSIALADLQTMRQREFDALSRSVDGMTRDIAAGIRFQQAARAFLAPANLAKLASLKKAMRHRDVTSRTDRALAALMGS